MLITLIIIFPSFFSEIQADGALNNQIRNETVLSNNSSFKQEAKNRDSIISDYSFSRKDVMSLIVSTLLGALIGFGTVILVEWLKTPNLIFERGSEDDDRNIRRKFIHIKVKNINRKIKFSPISTLTASSTRAIVKIADKEFNGRWTSKAEPLIYGQGNIPIAVDPNAILTTPREDLQPSKNGEEAVQIAIGVKYENEDEFYGFNNESYLYQQSQLKNPNYKFGLGNFEGEITLLTLGKKYNQKFKVYNPSKNRKDFHLDLTE